MLFGTRLLLIRGNTRRTGPRGISISATMAWDLSRTETLPYPEKQTADSWDPALQLQGPLDGISRSLAITGLGG